MKKLILSFSVIIAFAFYSLAASFVSRQSSSVLGSPPVSTLVITPSPSTPSRISATAQTGKAQAVVQKPKAGSSTASTGKYKDGSYTGSAADAYFGNVQVKATISGGTIADISFLQYPNDRHTSVSINQNAMPILVKEAVKSQSANVDIVSGATQTSQGFIQSLQNALSQAS